MSQTLSTRARPIVRAKIQTSATSQMERERSDAAASIAEHGIAHKLCLSVQRESPTPDDFI